MSCCRPDSGATARHFNATIALGDRQRYHAKGLEKRARRLVDAIARLRIRDASVLDVGSGVGLVAYELLARGAATATLSDISAAYLAAARQEAAERDLANRVHTVEGDFVEAAVGLQPADVVVLDRAICCYPAWQPLLNAAAARCRHALGLTYPRKRMDVRTMLAFENARRRFSGDGFRAFVHEPSAIEGALRALGLRRVSEATTYFWKIDVFVRDRELRHESSTVDLNQP